MPVPHLRRKPLYAPRGAVATSQPLAAAAGLAVLRRGGNAVDAAIAVAAALTVLQPGSNDLGSDLFALVWDGSRLHGLNASGRSPAALTLDAAVAGAARPSAALGGTQARATAAVPARGWLPVTVPGAPAGWRDLHRRFGSRPFAELFDDAVHYAAHGYGVSPTTAYHWQRALDAIRPELDHPVHAEWLRVFAPGGRAPVAGERFSNPDAAATLRLIAESGAEAFYRGPIAAAVADFAARTGGLLSRGDLADHGSTWVDPVSVGYRDHEVWELPPNGQGIAALQALGILDGFPNADPAAGGSGSGSSGFGSSGFGSSGSGSSGFGSSGAGSSGAGSSSRRSHPGASAAHSSGSSLSWSFSASVGAGAAGSAAGRFGGGGSAAVAAVHRQIEATKLGFADAHAYVTDPEAMSVPVAALLDPAYLAARRAMIGDTAGDPPAGDPSRGGTVYLCTADADGMMVSLIQSNYMGFGSFVVAPGTGFSLQNRGAGFSLDPAHPNVVAPGKRPFHTIIPGFLTRGGAAVGPFGVMGGHMQPQGHVQLVRATVDDGLDPQAALDRPRWYWHTGRTVQLEPGVLTPDEIMELTRRGHEVTLGTDPTAFGFGQAIWRDSGGGYVAGTEPRADGAAIGY